MHSSHSETLHGKQADLSALRLNIFLHFSQSPFHINLKFKEIIMEILLIIPSPEHLEQL